MAIKISEKIAHVVPEAEHREVLKDLGKAFGDNNGKLLIDGGKLKARVGPESCFGARGATGDFRAAGSERLCVHRGWERARGR